MPGWVGAVSTDGGGIDPELVRAMRNAICHQDWYVKDDYVDPRGTWAVSRVHLGILDRENQPFSAPDGRVKIFLHGAIFDEEASGSGPMEFIYRLYQQHGRDFASHLNGSFVVIVVDEEQDIAFLANDRVGTKPMFYFDDGRALYFSPEMKSLLRIPTLRRELNMTAVADFLASGQYLTDHTLIEDVNTMDGAIILKIERGGISWHKYWRYQVEPDRKDRGASYYRDTLAQLLRQAVRRRLRSGSTYGILLSGGYDSRAILGCWLEKRNAQELHTASWGREEEIPGSDCDIAGRLAHELGTDHRFYEISADKVIDDFRDFVLLGEGLTEYAQSHSLFQAIRVEQGIEIAFRGDESFGISDGASLTAHDELTALRASDIRALSYMQEWQRVLKPSCYKVLCDLGEASWLQIASRCHEEHPYRQYLRVAFESKLRHELIPLDYAISMTMECFTPWLDRDILDFVSTVPIERRVRKRFSRDTVVHMFPELFVEKAASHNLIDWNLSFRSSPKLERFIYEQLIESSSLVTEFVDVGNLKKELDAFFGASTRAVGKAGIRASALATVRGSPTTYRLLHKYGYHLRRRTGRIDHSVPTEQLILRLLILKVWGDVFLDLPVAGASR